MRRATNEIQMRQYLLGDMSQEERTSFEEQYFADADTFEELVAAEHNLIDSYIRGELKGSERQTFERRYGKSPHRRAKVAFAHALNQVSHQTARAEKFSAWKKALASWPEKLPIPRWAFAVVALVVVAAGAWLVVQNQKLRAELQLALTRQAEQLRQVEALRQQLGSLENPKYPSQENQQSPEVAQLERPVPELTLRLRSDVARGAGERQNTLILSSAGSWVRLQLMLNRDEYTNYQVSIKTAEGSEIRRIEGLKSQQADHGRAVVLRLPSNFIRPGDYVVTLHGSSDRGEEEADAYSLRVVRR